MGTITIEEYGYAGSGKESTDSVAKLDTLQATTLDASTSTSAENVTLQAGTNIISIHAVEQHRVSFDTDTTASKYAVIPAGTIRDFGIDPDTTIYYRADA